MLFEELLEMERRQTKLTERIETILEFLEELGTIPDDLKQCIISEDDLDVLKDWLKIAARATTIEEFEQNM